MPKKEIIFGKDDGLQKILAGVKIISKTVGSTLGPGGHNVILENFGWPTVTKDGVTVARNIELVDKFENIGAQMIRQVANKTCSDAGDGTTTATILASAIFEEGLKLLHAGYNAIDIQRSIKKASEVIIQYINDNIRLDIDGDYDRLKEIATVSANWDESIGKAVADAIDRVGIDGKIKINDPSYSSYETSVDFVDGIKFDRGYTTPYFVNNTEKQIAYFKDPLVLLFKGPITNVDQIMGLLRNIKDNNRAIVIVADDYEPEVTATLATNARAGRLQCVAVKAPHFAEMRLQTMEDLAVYLDTTYVDTEIEDVLQYGTLDNMSLSALGKCASVEVTQKTITFLGGAGDPKRIKQRIEDIKALSNDPEQAEVSRENAKIRVSQLCGAVANITIGASTEGEYLEKYDRFDDAINAAKSALAEGIVPGGSYAYIKAIGSAEFKVLLDSTDTVTRLGAMIIEKAITRPFNILLTNAGKRNMIGMYLFKIADNTTDTAFGYNAKTDTFENLLDAGVIDPYKVTRCALANAVSTAGLMLSADAIIADADPIKVTTQAADPPSLF